MGFLFLIEIPYYDFVIYDLCDCNLLLHRQIPLRFLGLVVAEAGVRWGFLLSRIIDFWLSFCGTVDCERLCRTCCSCTLRSVGF